MPLGRCLTLRAGRDVTIVSWGAMIKEALEAADQLAAENVEAEVIDVATLKPLDSATILASVERTGRLVIVHEAPMTCGYGAEIAARVAGRAMTSLLAPIERVTGYDTMMPYARTEAHYMPQRRSHHGGGAPRDGLHMSRFALPDLGEGLQEAEIVSWHVAEGDHVVVDQPLLSVETEKAVVEIPSPKAGHIARLLAKVGERVKVGAPCLNSRKARMPKPAPSWGSWRSRHRPPRHRQPKPQRLRLRQAPYGRRPRCGLAPANLASTSRASRRRVRAAR